VPFVFITTALTELAKSQSQNPPGIHATGHSLGASYATLCFSELLRYSKDSEKELPANTTLGDIYTFGSPRVASVKLGTSIVTNLENGSSWRIVNTYDSTEDIVPQVPPPKTPVKPEPEPFNHINGAGSSQANGGVMIYNEANFSYIPTEFNSDPLPVSLLTVSGWNAHVPWNYYPSLMRAMQPTE